MGYDRALQRHKRLIRKWTAAKRRAIKDMGPVAVFGLLGRSACTAALALIALASLVMLLSDGESIEEMMEIAYICLASGLIFLVVEYVLAKITMINGVDHSRDNR